VALTSETRGVQLDWDREAGVGGRDPTAGELEDTGCSGMEGLKEAGNAGMEGLEGAGCAGMEEATG
jgi:hypothetical protein